ncbi:MAG: MBL fold metallo-hydrolase [Lachnospiraceae bacterium]|nr:MBL fold metallo-hydrolase [Lachnospiraceae bacterium]
MLITFYGAVNSVTGSCHMITTGTHKILLDCGMYQGGKTLEAENKAEFEFVPSDVECVVLSHAHVDHCGRLPLLVKRGFKGPIYCTDATADLLQIMLPDCAYIQEKETEWANRKALRKGEEPDLEPLYDQNDVNETLKLVKPVLYNQQIDINESIKIVFNDAGHILGSAITELFVDEGEKTIKVVFTGDIGCKDRPILRDPVKIKKADYVIMESTYGDRLHESNEKSLTELLEIIEKTIKRGGDVIIPSFAVGRTQELIYELNEFYENNAHYHDFLKDVHVYIDSPMAISTTMVFRRNAQNFDETTKKKILEGDNPLDFPNLHFTKTSAESMLLNTDPSPKIIIAASGMCDAGRICHHLKHNLWEKKNSIVIVGYQAAGTLGRMLVDGESEVSVLGEKVAVKAEIYNLEGFSGHADMEGLLDWVSGLKTSPTNIFLVHGEDDAKDNLAGLIKNKFGFNVTPIHGITSVDTDEDGSGMTMEEVEEDLVDYEKVCAVRDKILGIHESIEDLLYSANLAVGEKITSQRLADIANIVAELEKGTINLGMAVTEQGRNNVNQSGFSDEEIERMAAEAAAASENNDEDFNK